MPPTNTRKSGQLPMIGILVGIWSAVEWSFGRVFGSIIGLFSQRMITIDSVRRKSFDTSKLGNRVMLNASSVADNFPPFEEIDRRTCEDWGFVEQQTNSGALEPYAGEFVGVYMKEIVAHGDSDQSVRQQFEATRGISGNKLVVAWIENDDIR